MSEHRIQNVNGTNLDGLDPSVGKEDTDVLTRERVVSGVLALVGGVCVAGVTKTVVKNNVFPSTRLGKVQVFIAAGVIGSMVAAQAETHIHRKVGEAAQGLRELRDLFTEEV